MLDTRDEGAVRVLSLNRPEALNAFNGALFDALVEGLLTARDDDSVSVVVITGAGRAFTAGADLSEMGQKTAPPKHGFAGMVDTLIDYTKPVIAAINGAAIGVGGTICGPVDIVLMAESAKMRCPFAALGINPEAGSSITFPEMMGPQRAAWFLYSADTLSAQDCLHAGMALEVLPDDDFLDHVLERAGRLAAQAPNSLRETRALPDGAAQGGPAGRRAAAANEASRPHREQSGEPGGDRRLHGEAPAGLHRLRPRPSLRRLAGPERLEPRPAQWR
ncbi:MAG: enoyl-CoA hydratase/isomerase family protein [Gammaproteobacteria bacterium]|nr:enoyl-CoA hydratase/isomerase family protein [Gammaproteobacteria bacterium]